MVHRNAPQSRAAESQQSRGFVEGVMRLNGSVQHRARAEGCDSFFDRARKACGQGQRQRTEVGLVAAAGECAVKLGIPTDALTDPTHRLLFDLRGQLGPRQTGQLRIEGCHQGFGEYGHISRRRIHQAKVVGAGHMKAANDQLRTDVVENLGRIFAEFGKLVGEIVEGA